jgi:hypothetical protein
MITSITKSPFAHPSRRERIAGSRPGKRTSTTLPLTEVTVPKFILDRFRCAMDSSLPASDPKFLQSEAIGKGQGLQIHSRESGTEISSRGHISGSQIELNSRRRAPSPFHMDSSQSVANKENYFPWGLFQQGLYEL